MESDAYKNAQNLYNEVILNTRRAMSFVGSIEDRIYDDIDTIESELPKFNYKHLNETKGANNLLNVIEPQNDSIDIEVKTDFFNKCLTEFDKLPKNFKSHNTWGRRQNMLIKEQIYQSIINELADKCESLFMLEGVWLDPLDELWLEHNLKYHKDSYFKEKENMISLKLVDAFCNIISSINEIYQKKKHNLSIDDDVIDYMLNRQPASQSIALRYSSVQTPAKLNDTLESDVFGLYEQKKEPNLLVFPSREEELSGLFNKNTTKNKKGGKGRRQNTRRRKSRRV